MRPEVSRAATICERAFKLLTRAMLEYDNGSVAGAIERSANVASREGGSELVQFLAEILNN